MKSTRRCMAFSFHLFPVLPTTEMEGGCRSGSRPCSAANGRASAGTGLGGRLGMHDLAEIGERAGLGVAQLARIEDGAELDRRVGGGKIDRDGELVGLAEVRLMTEREEKSGTG